MSERITVNSAKPHWTILAHTVVLLLALVVVVLKPTFVNFAVFLILACLQLILHLRGEALSTLARQPALEVDPHTRKSTSSR